MPRIGFKMLAVCAALAGGTIGLQYGPAGAQSIYETNVAQKLDLTAKQRSQVQKIVAESGRKSRAIFKKYGIDPNARPVFDKLQQASTELQAIQQEERRQMRQVLNDDQYKQYNRIVQETQARVRAAAQ